MAFDKEYGGDEFDLLTDVGFLNALYHTTMLEAGASAMAAPVCSTFVFMWLACLQWWKALIIWRDPRVHPVYRKA